MMNTVVFTLEIAFLFGSRFISEKIDFMFALEHYKIIRRVLSCFSFNFNPAYSV
jgi:hypothetical protein